MVWFRFSHTTFRAIFLVGIALFCALTVILWPRPAHPATNINLLNSGFEAPVVVGRVTTAPTSWLLSGTGGTWKITYNNHFVATSTRVGLQVGWTNANGQLWQNSSAILSNQIYTASIVAGNANGLADGTATIRIVAVGLGVVASTTATIANGQTQTLSVNFDSRSRPDAVGLNLRVLVTSAGVTTWEQARLSYNPSPAPQPGAIAFNSSTYSFTEGQTSTITLNRTGGSSGAVSAQLNFANGTATAPGDFTSTPIVVSFATGETSKSVTLPIINDLVVESNETFQLSLSNLTGGATLGSPSTATVTIVDNDTASQGGAIAFESATYSGTEGALMLLTLVRTGGSVGAVSARVNLANGTATAGADYFNDIIRVDFGDGQTSQVFAIPVINDSLIEPNETIFLTLSNPGGGATLGSPASAVFTILDNDIPLVGAIAFPTSTYTATEGQTSTITLNRTGGSAGAVSVQLNFANGTATAPGDFTSTPIVVNFADGETSKTIALPIIDDTTAESNEEFQLSLSNLTGGATLGNRSTAIVTILDNDDNSTPPPAVSIFQFSPVPQRPSVTEGQELELTIERDNAADDALVRVVAGSSPSSYGQRAGDDDYIIINPTLQFFIGELTKTVRIMARDDSRIEGREVVRVALTTAAPNRISTVRDSIDFNIEEVESALLPSVFRTAENRLILVTGERNSRVEITYNTLDERVPIRPIDCGLYQFWNTDRFHATDNQVTIYSSGGSTLLEFVPRAVSRTSGQIPYRGAGSVCNNNILNSALNWSPLGIYQAARVEVTGWDAYGARDRATEMVFISGLPGGEQSASDGRLQTRRATGNRCGFVVLGEVRGRFSLADFAGGFRFNGNNYDWGALPVRERPQCYRDLFYYPDK